MNERLIDANALLNEIVDFKHDAMNADDYNAYDVVEKAIRAMPTIGPESLRPVGRWELFGNDDEVGCSYREEKKGCDRNDIGEEEAKAEWEEWQSKSTEEKLNDVGMSMGDFF